VTALGEPLRRPSGAQVRIAGRAPATETIAGRLARADPTVVAVLFAAICYLPALRDGFALDDVPIIRDNLQIHSLATLPQALTVPYWYAEGHLYRPLTTLSFGLEWLLGGGQPLLFHTLNLAWHALVTVLVVRLALRWWSPLAAAIAGVWFAVHPVHAEAVTNIVGRSELVCAAALLGIALCASGEPASASPASRRREWWRIFGLAAAAMASKEVGAVAPCIAWAAATTPLPAVARRDTARAWRLAGAAGAGVGTLIVARLIVLGSFAGDAPHYAFTLVSGTRAILLALATIPTAVGLVIVPQPPRLDYSPSEAMILHPPTADVFLGLACVCAALGALWWHARRPNPWTLAACFAAATFAPVSNLLVRTGIIVADRTLYSPSIGVALIAGGAVAAAWTARRWLHVMGAAAMTAMGAMFTMASLGAWHDSRTAFVAIRDRSPDSFIGHYMVAKVYDSEGDKIGAATEYGRALALTPHNAPLLYMAGASALRRRDTATAVKLITRSVALGPTSARARTALAALDLVRGDTLAAIQLLRAGLALDPTVRVWRDMLHTLGDSARGGR
jgi:protein O-mannosyl-transferase